MGKKREVLEAQEEGARPKACEGNKVPRTKETIT